jgi:RNA polymerase sigma-70 factor (ECF subfamily)
MSRRDDTEMGGTGYAFLTTQWSLINGFQSNVDKDGSLISALLKQYWKPVFCYLRRRGYDNEPAKDLTQGFFHEIVLNRDLLGRADQHKGHFRAFLLHALDQYLINEESRKKTQKRYPKGGLIPLEATDLLTLPQMISSMTPEDCYNYTWLSDLLGRVLVEVETDCHSDGLDLHWMVFRERIVMPILEDAPSPSTREVCDKYGIDNEKKVSNMLVTVKRRFQTAIRKHVRDTVSNEDDIDDEVQELFQYLP